MPKLSWSRAAPLGAGFAMLALFAALGAAPPYFPTVGPDTLETAFLGLAFAVLLASRLAPFEGAVRRLAWPVGLAVVGLFAWKLGALWSAGGGNAYAIGGLLPYNDATGYYDEARYFLEHGRLKEMNVGRRPISSILLAALLGLSGLNLQAAVALLTGLTAAACLTLARAVAWRYGWTAALVFAAVLFAYISTYIGTTLSESAGLALGCAGLALAWTGAGTRRLPVFTLGLGLLTLGLLARAGAFFVLPALLIWAAHHFHDGEAVRPWHRNISWRTVIAGAGAIAAAFAFNKLMLTIYAPNDHIVFSNFPWTLYGIAVGGKGWSQVLIDHPYIAELPQTERIAEIYRLILAAIADNPFNFARGVLHQYNAFFFDSGWHTFIDNKIVRSLVQLSTLAALWVIFKRRRNWQEGFLFAALLGLFASIPALADGGPRVYAATQGLTAIVAAVGASALVGALARRLGRATPDISPPNQSAVVGPPLGFGLLLLGLIAAGIGLSSTYAAQPAAAAGACPPGQSAINARLSPGSYIHVVADAATRRSRAPVVRVSDFRRGIGEGGVRLHRALKAQPAPFLLLSVHQLGADAARWLVLPMAELPPVPSTLAICGVPAAPITRALSWSVK
jgi:hypothetical protein